MINNKYPNISPSLNLDFTNSNTIDPRITFSRASAATYYDGKTVAKAEENLLTYSQDYTVSSWAKTYSSITANSTVAPDGTTTASTLTDTATASDHAIGKTATTLVSVPYTVSTYLKQGTAQYIIVCLQGGALGVHWAAATVNMSTGVITQQSNGVGVTGVSTSIASTGNGWYRVTVTATSSSETAFSARVMFSDTATPTLQNYCYYPFTGTGANTVYLWGTQIEQRAYPTAYTPTTSTPITNYIPVLQTALSGVPRIDHDPVTGECKGLLIEEQRTNLLTYSEQLDNNSWGKADAAVAANSFVAPDGSLTADVVTVMASGGYIAKTAVVGATSGQTYSISIFTNTLDRKLTFGGATPNYLNASYSSTPIGNGWYRHTGTVTLNADGYVQLILARGSASAGTSFAAWGAQTELGAFPTSYIKTEASQVTRAADSASMTGANFSSWYRQDEGTLFAEALTFKPTSITSGGCIASTDNGSYANRHFMTFWGSTVESGVITNSSTQADGTTAYVPNTFYKIVSSIQKDNYAAYRNGAQYVTDPSVQVPSVFALSIGKSPVGSELLNGHIKRITYYPKRLTNAQLQALTA